MTPDRSAPVLRNRQATAREFFAVVFRRKWIILGLFLVVTLTVLVVVFSSPTNYRSIGKVAIRRGEQESLLQPGKRISNWEEEIATEVQVVRSQPVADRAQALLDERARHGGPKVRLVAGELDAEVVGASNAVLIAYTDRNPGIARAACDAVVTAYVAYRQETVNLTYPKAFFDTEIQKVSHDLAALEEKRRNYTTVNGAAAIEDQQRMAISTLANLRQRSSEIQSDLAEARATLQQMRKFASDPNLDVPTFGNGEGEQVLVDLRIKVLNQETRLAQLRERYRDDSPDVQNATMTLETLRGLLAREANSRVEIASTRVQALEARLRPCEAEIHKIEGELESMPNKEMSLSEMDRQIAVLKDRYGELVRSSDQARITEQTRSNVNIVVLEPAGQAHATNARDWVRLALAPGFSLVVGIGLAFFVDGLDTRIRTAADAETTLELPVLASLTERRRRDALAVLPSEEPAPR